MPLKTIITLAWRNLWRNYRRTLIMLIAISIGAWAMIFLTAMTRGMIDNMIEGGIASLPGHIQIHHPRFRDDPNIENSMNATPAALLKVLNSSDVTKWGERVRVSAVISSERDSRGVSLVGIDPEKAVGITSNDIIEGRFLESPTDKGLVIGAKLAHRLETRLGKRVVIMSQDPNNNIVDKGFRIVGIFKAKLEIQEESLILTGRETAQKLLKLDNKISEIAVMGENYNSLEPLVQLLKNSAPELEILPWSELDKFLGSTHKMMDSVVFIYVLVIFLALSFGLVNTLVMAIFERMREIGLMQALGMRPSNILTQILVEAFLLLAIGLLAGNLIAVATIYWLSDGIDVSIVGEGMAMMGVGSTLSPSFYWQDLILANVVVFILGLLASLFPAWHASHLDPIVALTKN